jgi:hypothetical protein
MPTTGIEPETSRRQLEGLYRATVTPQFIEVPELVFLALDGHGDPNTSAGFAQAVQALYAVSYAVKFAIKRSGGPDHKVSPLEALWWAEDMSSFSLERKADWNWTAMIRQPDQVGADMVARLAEEAAAKKGILQARELRLQCFTEGHTAQVMHIGPYAAEGPTIARLHAFIHDHGFTFDGRRHKHHEIYLGDPRRSRPERLKTIIRQPFAGTALPARDEESP